MTEKEKHVSKLQVQLNTKDEQLIEQSEENSELRAALDKVLILS